MVFSSLVFIFLFLPLFLLIYFIIPNRKYRNFVLLGCSLFFYAWGEPLFVMLLIGSIIFNYLMAIVMDRSKQHKKPVFVGIVIANILLLTIFKYTNFIIDNINVLFHMSIAHAKISLPLGISFYTFLTLTYIIDLYKGEVKLQKNIMTFGTYIAAFPPLISGPIVRYKAVESELTNRKESFEQFTDGIRRFIIGLGKKTLIAGNVGFVADTIFNQGIAHFGMTGAWLGLICYTLQIYFDFSGYSDMAIGLGKMMGFTYPENFNYPYIAKTITDFWRRWHISLSTFFRDYVYIPLGGNRVSSLKWYRNIFAVWMLTGLWHGASWNFVLWGLYYGIILVVEKKVLSKYLQKAPAFITHLYAVVLIMFGWLIFRSENLTQLSIYIKTLVGLNGFGNVGVFVIAQILQVKYIVAIILGIICSTPALKILSDKIKALKGGIYIYDAISIVLYMFFINLLLTDGFNPFIYFKF